MSKPIPAAGRLEKIGYGIGDLASSFYINFFNIYLLYFFVELGGVGPAAMGLMLLVVPAGSNAACLMEGVGDTKIYLRLCIS